MLKIVENSESRNCCQCGSIETTRYRGVEHWHKCKCGKDLCTGWLCKICYTREHHKSPDGYVTTINSMSKHDTGLLSIDSETGKGLIGEAIIAKVRKLGIVAIKSNNFRSKFDLSIDEEYRNIQVKIATPQYGDWYASIGKDHNFDILFGLCMDKSMKNVKRSYIIPVLDLLGVKSISFRKNSVDSKWEKFRIDEKPYNESCQSLMTHLKDKKFFGVNDISKWLEM